MDITHDKRLGEKMRMNSFFPENTSMYLFLEGLFTLKPCDIYQW